jgi:hypothetical protein
MNGESDFARACSLQPREVYIMAYNINWTYHQWSISQFYREAATINCDPEWQRRDVDILFKAGSFPSKAQCIIASILLGLDVGEIKLALYRGKRASIDGGNRKRAILSFLRNEFPLHKKSVWGQSYFKDLDPVTQDSIWNYQMRVIVYDDMKSSTIGYLFRTTNTVTEVNPQEMRNSYGDDPLAIFVRRLVRVIPEVGNTTHLLYDNTIGKDGEPRYRYLSFNNLRLKMEDQLARIVHRVINGETPGVSPDKALNEMYDTVGPMWEKNPEEQAKIEKKVKAALDFFLKVANSARGRRGQGLTIGQFSLLTRVYFHMKEKYDTFKVNNYDAFWDQFARAFVAVENRRDLIKIKDKLGNIEDGDRTVGEAFRGYLSFDIPQDWKYFDALNWFLQEFDPLNVITPKDPKRCFSAKVIEDKLILQNWTDYIDGLPLSLKDAVGAHKIAHTNGGKTVGDNLVVISEKHNSAMGSMDVDTYKQWFLRENQ